MSNIKKFIYRRRNTKSHKLRQRYYTLRHKIYDPDIIKRGASYDFINEYESYEGSGERSCCKCYYDCNHSENEYDNLGLCEQSFNCLGYRQDKFIFSCHCRYCRHLYTEYYNKIPSPSNLRFINSLDDIHKLSNSPFKNLQKKIFFDKNYSLGNRLKYIKINEHDLIKYIKKLDLLRDYSLPEDGYHIITSQILKSTRSIKDTHALEAASTTPSSNDFFKNVIIFSPFWVRDPQSWDPGGSKCLLEHLFCIYDIPAFLRKSWFSKFERVEFKWILWFMIMGQGGSLKRASKHFAWNIKSGFQQFLFDAREDATPLEACIHAEIKRLGGSARETRRLLEHPGFRINPTVKSINDKGYLFWSETVKWIIAYGDDMTDEQCGLVLDWALHERIEANRTNSAPFSWKQRSLSRVLERSHAFSLAKQRGWTNHNWKKHGYDLVFEESPGQKWSFVELTSGRDLFVEGETHRHCSLTYTSACVSGNSAIVSLLLNEMPRVTIEVNPQTRTIVQAKGHRNRDPNEQEKRVISLWRKSVLGDGAF